MKDSLQVPKPSTELIQKAFDTRLASKYLSQSLDSERIQALQCMADSLASKSNQIVEANQRDLSDASQKGISPSLISRLKLNKEKLNQAIQGVEKLAFLPDPIGLRQLHRELSQGLTLERVSVPLGVLGVIFEARPDALIQIASLAIRSGNGAILKGGKEAITTNEAIIQALHEGLSRSKIDPQSISLLTTRKESLALLQLDDAIDLLIPRGSNELVRFIKENTSIPVLGHADGICHLYIDSSADLKKALKISLDSKVQYPAACNTIETLLIHQDIAKEFLSYAIPEFTDIGVDLIGDKRSQELGVTGSAEESDWSTEYLDLKLSIRVVDNLDIAIDHINTYSSRHTDAIVAESEIVAEKFLKSIDSSGVYHNCSTRFADGFRYGFGAEVGISTQTLPPRGPVGLEGLVTYKYLLRGQDHVASEFASGKMKFTHKDLYL